MPNEISHSYQFEKSISVLNVVGPIGGIIHFNQILIDHFK